jgi:aminotransferase
LLIVNSPNNPTGCMIAPEDLEQIAWWAERRDVLILSDEVFAPYQYDGQGLSIGVLSRASRRTLTIGSISKAYGLASARVGWLAGHRHLVRPCKLTATLHTPFVPTVCQQIALSALQQAKALESIRSQFDSKRRYVFERLRAAGLKPVWPAGAFFFWVPVGDFADSGRAFASQFLKEKRILVSPGDLFGPHGGNHVRVSYAAEEGRLREGLARLVDFVRGCKERTPASPKAA